MISKRLGPYLNRKWYDWWSFN